MSGFKFTYCTNCESQTAHDIYISDGDHLHSLCTDCGKDVPSRAEVDTINGEGNKYCENCETNTEHLRYISSGGYIHWFCCSCGKDIVGRAQTSG